MIRDSWLADVAPDAPCGPDLQYDQDFLALEAAARGKPEQQYGTTVIAAEDPDWPGVAKSAAALLDRAHDLRVLQYYARAATHTEGLRGLADALALVRDWLVKYWEPLHPTLVIDGEPEPEIRMFALSALADGDGLLRDLRAADLPLGAIVVNQLRDPLLSDKALRSVRNGRTAKLAEGVAADLASVGVKATAGVVSGLLVDAAQHADRVALEREQDAVLDGQGRLTVRLPLLPEGTEGGGISVLADAVAEQGMI